MSTHVAHVVTPGDADWGWSTELGVFTSLEQAFRACETDARRRSCGRVGVWAPVSDPVNGDDRHVSAQVGGVAYMVVRRAHRRARTR